MEAGISPEQRAYGLAAIWSEVKYNYPMWHRLPDLDWDGEFRRRIPEVLAAKSDLEYYRILAAFIALIRDSHVSVSFPQPVREFLAEPPVALWAIGERIVVVGYAVGAKSDAPLGLGDEILSVDGVAVLEYARREVDPYLACATPQALRLSRAGNLLRGRRGSAATVVLQKPGGQQYTCVWKRDAADKNSEWVWYDPVRPGRMVSVKVLSPRTGYIRVPTFGDKRVVDEFSRALEGFEQSNNLIIDLRTNGGGNSGYSDKIMQHLIDSPVDGMIERRLSYLPALRGWQQGDKGQGKTWERVKLKAIKPAFSGVRFQGKLVILVSAGTASAAEDFVGPLKVSGRARLIGEPTNGSTGNPMFFKLPGGGSFRVCTRYMLLPDGTEFIGKGIPVDIEVRPSPSDIAGNRDPVIDRAVTELERR